MFQNPVRFTPSVGSSPTFGSLRVFWFELYDNAPHIRRGALSLVPRDIKHREAVRKIKLDVSDKSHVGQICNLPVSFMSLGFGQITNLGSPPFVLKIVFCERYGASRRLFSPRPAASAVPLTLGIQHNWRRAKICPTSIADFCRKRQISQLARGVGLGCHSHGHRYLHNSFR